MIFKTRSEEHTSELQSRHIISYAVFCLKKLDCGYNEMSNLDTSKNLALEELNCANNKITKLDLSNNVLLETLHCDDNVNVVRMEK